KQVEFEPSIVVPASEKTHVVDEESIEEEVDTEEPQQQLESIANRRPKRTMRVPARYANTVAEASVLEIHEVLTTYQEAVNNSEGAKWRIAMEEEMKSLDKNKTWKLYNLPKG
ncbi:hypothetical protein, partial [Plesiomonas shigelloides]